MNNEFIKVKRDDLQGLYQVLTNYPAISKEQVQNEMHKVFGEETFKPKDIMGNEEEAVYALAGFMRQPQGRELLKRAAALSMAESLMKAVLNVK